MEEEVKVHYQSERYVLHWYGNRRKRSGGKQFDKKRGTILIVEDNKEILHYLESRVIRTVQYNSGAYNGEEALEILKEKDVDVVVTDVMMLAMDGLNCAKASNKIYQEPATYL